MEFQFWESWESDDNVAEAIERHWFRSDSGLEALGLRENQPRAVLDANEWDRRVPQTQRVIGENVVVEIIEPKRATSLVYGTQWRRRRCAATCTIDASAVSKSQDLVILKLKSQDIVFTNGKKEGNFELNPLH